MTTAETTRHETSLAVWDIPGAITAGEHFAVKVGAKSSAGCALAGCRVEVLDGGGAVIGSGRLGAEPWPGTGALFWSEVELCAPPTPGVAPLAVRFAAAGLDEAHDEVSAPFSVAVVAVPEHVLTVTVSDGDGPIADAIVRAGPIRATTDAAGRARLHLPKGRHALVVWKAGYDAPETAIEIAADAFIGLEARAQPEDDPDAAWTA